MPKKTYAARNADAQEALNNLMDALHERHSSLYKTVQFAEARNDTGIATYQQALHACRYWIELGRKVSAALSGEED